VLIENHQHLWYGVHALLSSPHTWLYCPDPLAVTLSSMLIATDTGPLVGIAAGAVVAALGYVGKLVTESWREWRRAEAESLAQLFKLQALLRASRTAFIVQRELADRLADQLTSEHANDLPSAPGLERLFSHLHTRFSPAEAELHEVIRAYTEHAMRPINESLADWLRDDASHRVIDRRKNQREIQLAELLNQLDSHLLLWLAKYERWIPGRPDHALVYLDDEERHGLGFPRGLDDAVDELLAEHRPQGRVGSSSIARGTR
jgi:hypothetical protein